MCSATFVYNKDAPVLGLIGVGLKPINISVKFVSCKSLVKSLIKVVSCVSGAHISSVVNCDNSSRVRPVSR